MKLDKVIFNFETCRESENTGLFSLDIELGSDMNGIQPSRYIRAIQPNCYIAFMTTHAELTFVTLEARVEPFGYIDKSDYDQERNKISECIKRVIEKEKEIEQHQKKRTKFRVSTSLDVKLEDIICIEVTGKGHVYTINGGIETDMRLKDIVRNLDSSFFELNRSVIINIDRTNDFDAYVVEEIIMSDGRRFTVNNKTRERLKDKIEENLKQRALDWFNRDDNKDK